MNIFYEKLDNHIQTLNEKFRAKYLIKKGMYGDFILVLRDGWGNPQFKYWVQNRGAIFPLLLLVGGRWYLPGR
jgi:hypothetical protein